MFQTRRPLGRIFGPAEWTGAHERDRHRVHGGWK